jgi:beta-1,4-mannosyl-glycoprotein beta-1,4-N-acetylglucosaminyltransferase
MKVIDCFTFYNELTLLEYRLATLSDIVDYFIIVEARQTHMGKEKDLYYLNNKECFSQYTHKIIHIVVDLPYKSSELNTEKDEQWRNEEFQRNCIIRGFSRIELEDKDILLISDLDEIPDPTMLKMVRNGTIAVSIEKLEQDFFYYNLHSLFQHKWTMARILTFATFEELGLPINSLRAYECPSIKRGGWHLSYFGDKHFIQNKLQNFAHAEHNTPTTSNLDTIQWHIDNIECIVGHEFKMKRLSLKDNEYPPPNANKYLAAFI